MSYQTYLRHSNLFILCALLFSSCSSGADNSAQLEVIDLRYESSETSHCAGEVKNISSLPLNNLKVEVEFQTANGERVREKTAELAQSALEPNASSNFSVPYLKGSNDSTVVTCRVLRFKIDEDRAILHLKRRVK